MRAISRTSLVALSLLAFAVPANAAPASDTFERELTVPDAVTLDVRTGSGSIKIRSGSGREASIVGHVKVNKRWFLGNAADAKEILQAIQENPPVELDDGRLRVGYFKDRGLERRVSVSYEIVVPADTVVIASTGSGSVAVNDIAASVEAESGSGRLRLDNIGGAVSAETGSGSIRAEQVAGGFRGSSGSGSIFLSQVAPGDVQASSGSGSIELQGVAGALKAKSGSGRIRVDGSQEGDWVIDTGSGSVRVTLPADAAFSIDAESNSGSISVDHPLMVEGKISKKHIRGAVRGGGPLLKVDTGSGSIKVN